MTNTQKTHANSTVHRVDVVSDTHGMLPDKLLSLLEGAEVILYAGDVCSPEDLETLNGVAPTYAVLGNNDWSHEYELYFGKDFERLPIKHLQVELFGVRWEICHYRESLYLDECDVAICGHTHKPYIETLPSGVIVMNPGSPCRPRSSVGPTFGRFLVSEEKIVKSEIVKVPTEQKRGWFFF